MANTDTHKRPSRQATCESHNVATLTKDHLENHKATTLHQTVVEFFNISKPEVIHA